MLQLTRECCFVFCRRWYVRSLPARQDDRKHRAAWRELYTDSDADFHSLKDLVTLCRASGVHFIYSLAPGLDMQHCSMAEREALDAKIDQLLALGVTSFAMLFDDIPDSLCDADVTAFTTQVGASRR